MKKVTPEYIVENYVYWSVDALNNNVHYLIDKSRHEWLLAIPNPMPSYNRMRSLNFKGIVAIHTMPGWIEAHVARVNTGRDWSMVQGQAMMDAYKIVGFPHV